MLEIGFVGAGGILLEQREVAVGVGVGQAIQLGQHHRLDHGEAFSGAVAQVVIGLRKREAVEEFPAVSAR